MYTILPPDLQPLYQLTDKLTRKPTSSRTMDQQIHAALLNQQEDNPPYYTQDLNAAVALIPHGWWWHISHLEASVCPNRPEPDIPVSNAIDYRFTGNPVKYTASLWGERDALPAAVCIALLLARCALKTKAAAKRDNRMYLIQTGDGPMLVDRDGTLKELPNQAWLSQEGKLIAHKEAFPQYDFMEPEPDESDEPESM